MDLTSVANLRSCVRMRRIATHAAAIVFDVPQGHVQSTSDISCDELTDVLHTWVFHHVKPGLDACGGVQVLELGVHRRLDGYDRSHRLLRQPSQPLPLVLPPRWFESAHSRSYPCALTLFQLLERHFIIATL